MSVWVGEETCGPRKIPVGRRPHHHRHRQVLSVKLLNVNLSVPMGRRRKRKMMMNGPKEAVRERRRRRRRERSELRSTWSRRPPASFFKRRRRRPRPPFHHSNKDLRLPFSQDRPCWRPWNPSIPVPLVVEGRRPVLGGNEKGSSLPVLWPHPSHGWPFHPPVRFR